MYDAILRGCGKHIVRTRHVAAVFCCAIAISVGASALADPCIAPDDSSGTVSLPPEGCAYLTGDEVHEIIDGLPPDTTIELAPIHLDFICRKTDPGNPDHCGVDDGSGTGGEIEVFDSEIQLRMRGTGDLDGFQRDITMSLFCQTQTQPRTPGAPIQDFDNEMVILQGSLLPGDPDFQSLTIVAGSGNGLPSPGHTTLTRLGPPGSSFVVDSFFDIAYRIDYQGAPGGALDGIVGSTTGTVHMEAGDSSCVPTAARDGCESIDPCDDANQVCDVKCVNYNAASGEANVIDCGCTNQGDCHVEFTPSSGPTLRGATGNDCVVVEGPPGTVTLPPPGCAYLSPDDVHLIIAGLPAGTVLELDPIHDEFSAQIPPAPGGQFPGGEVEQFNSFLTLNVQGNPSGVLAGFNRTLFLPVGCEAHTGPRTPGNAVQTFPTDMFRLQGELFGDPDFCTFRVTGGTDFGLPSPGQTTLTRLGPPGSDFRVDSFFDIAYQIEFQGCPGSALDGFGGTTTATVRMQTGLQPNCDGDCPPGFECVESVTPQPDGSVDFCCDCQPVQDCGPTPGGDACLPVDCPNATDQCLATCANFDPVTGLSTMLDCECRDAQTCHIEAVPGSGAGGSGFRGAPGNPCVIPEDPPASGTVTLPPAGCEYLSPDEVHMIIDGLPAGTEIELAPIHRDFICKTQPGAGFPGCPPPGLCEGPDGSGGNVDCFTSQLVMDVRGNTGGALDGYVRNLIIPIDCQVRTGPRNPGDPVQDFDSEMTFLQGELFGDPDFCLLRVTGGTSNGLPSPGHTTLTELPSGNFTVDSFFDIAYRIEFQGCPGSPLDGFGGTTEATIRMTTGAPPRCVGDCPPNTTCVDTQTVLADGTIDVCCECVPTLPPCKDHDVDCSGVTNAVDIGVIRAIANFNKNVCDGTPGQSAAVPRADVDRNTNVNAVDIGVVRAIANFNTATGPCVCTPHPNAPCP